MQAVHNGHDEVVRVLCERGADITLTGPDGWTAVLVAAAVGDTDCLAVLLKHSASLLDLSTNKDNIMHVAAEAGETSFLDHLITNHSDTATKLVNQKNGRGLTPLMVAATRGYLDVVQSLVKCPQVDVQATDGQGKTAGEVARAEGFDEVARALGSSSVMDVFAFLWCC